MYSSAGRGLAQTGYYRVCDAFTGLVGRFSIFY